MVLLIALASLFGGAASAVAQSNESLQPKDLKNELAPGIRYGGKFEVDLNREKNFDLDKSVDNDEVTFEPQFQFAISYQPTKNVLAFGEFELKRTFFIDRPPDTESEGTELDVDQLYLQFNQPEYGLVVSAGRVDYEDDLEWIYDQELDGVRALFNLSGPFHAELSANREELFFPENILGSPTDDEINNYMARLRYDAAKRIYVDGYVYARDDVGLVPEDKIFFGLQSVGRVSDFIVADDQLRFWTNAAYVTGHDDDPGVDISGFGFDVFGTYIFAHKLEPSVTMGFAIGTGDRDGSDGTDHSFRQTGLQDNDAKFNGNASFKYYGEVFDPELSNLLVYTLGFGIQPIKDTSIDIVYHKYWQQYADDEIRDTDIDLDPNGVDKDLGQEIDVIFGYEPTENLDLKLIFGAFFPGEAFSSSADTATVASFEIEYKF